MAGGVIKGRTTTYVYVNNFDTDEPVMKTVYGKRPEKKPSQAQLTDAEKAVEALLAEDDEQENGGSDSGETVSAEEARVEREKLIAEYEAIRSKYEHEAEQFVIHAKEKATEIYDKTKKMAEETVLEARTEADNIRKQAEENAKRLAETSKQQGYEEGVKQGYDEGYLKALKKCKESLVELKATAEQITAEKTDIMMQYERQLFDTIFDICQKVTIGALGQKDKAVITRMIREAGKKYKASKTVKITLSKLDVSEEAEIDEQLLKDVFKNCSNVDIEILEDMPAGTLLIDDGAEITDASVMTQLKMVEQLGKGKYRDKSIGDMLQENRDTAKPKRGRRKASDDADNEQLPPDGAADDDTAVPDVVYKTGREQDDDDIESQIENA